MSLLMLIKTYLVKMVCKLRQVTHFKEGPPFLQQTEGSKGAQYQEIGECAHVSGSIKGAVNLGKTVNSHTSVQTATGLTQKHIVKHKNSKQDTQLYSLANSPICISEVQKSLSSYPMQNVAFELIEGLKFGFQLKYSGSRLPFRSKNSPSVLKNPDLVLRKINKEIDMGRIAGPFDDPPFPT